ncbi:MAG: glycosyltransferase family 4 protein [Anaerolineales bacterium]|nr:glycosyltransferase family 4 protein [Anaerolineales bacterium]
MKNKQRIVLGVPEWEPFHQVMMGQPADATYVIQGNLSKGLMARGHSLLFSAPNGVDDFIFTSDPQETKIALRTWSANSLFTLVSKLVWRIQKLFGIPYLNFFSNYRFYDAALQNLKDVDVIYERNGLYNYGLAMASKRLKLSYVIFFEADQIMELDIMNKPITGLLRWRANQILRYNLNTADCVICVTDAGKRHLVAKWNIPAKKIVVFPNAVHVDRFKPDVDARGQIRQSLGMKDEPMVMFVGNFFHWHDVTTLLKAFASTLKTCPDARLVLVGDGEHKAEMMKFASDIGLDHAVKFTGIVPHAEVPRYIASADIAVVPYPPMQQEMWLSPLKLFEYMSSGKAVVASAVGQIVDVLQDGKNGLLVSPGDAVAMSSALIKLIQDPNLRLKLGTQAREDAVQKFSWESYLTRLERIFNAIIARQPVDTI